MADYRLWNRRRMLSAILVAMNRNRELLGVFLPFRQLAARLTGVSPFCPQCRRSVKFDYAKAGAEVRAKEEEKAKVASEALGKK